MTRGKRVCRPTTRSSRPPNSVASLAVGYPSRFARRRRLTWNVRRTWGRRDGGHSERTESAPMLEREKVRQLYDAGARRYELTTWLFRLVGLRMHTYRVRAVQALRLGPGGSVVELGCGTGLNFSLILERIGQQGRLVGVDLSGGMLDVARSRIEKSGWRNVELVEQDISTFDLTGRVDAILAVGVFGYLAEYGDVIRRASEALSPGGRLVLLDGKQPEKLPAWLFQIVLALGRPYGYTREYFNVRPWEAMQRWLVDVTIEQHYGGMIYIAAGTAR